MELSPHVCLRTRLQQSALCGRKRFVATIRGAPLRRRFTASVIGIITLLLAPPVYSRRCRIADEHDTGKSTTQPEKLLGRHGRIACSFFAARGRHRFPLVFLVLIAVLAAVSAYLKGMLPCW